MNAATPPLRADAERNRRSIVDAAVEAFGRVGPDVPMDEIAKAAGVGVGTLYRRFPDRRALVVAVVHEALTNAVRLVEDASREERHAWQALVRVMSGAHGLRVFVRPDRPLPPDLADHLATHPELRRLRVEAVSGLDRIVQAAQAEGALRADVGTGDVVRLFAMVKWSGAHLAPDAAARSLAIMLDGLSTAGHTSLPGDPLGLDEVLARHRDAHAPGGPGCTRPTG